MGQYWGSKACTKPTFRLILAKNSQHFEGGGGGYLGNFDIQYRLILISTLFLIFQQLYVKYMCKLLNNYTLFLVYISYNPAPINLKICTSN